MKTKKIYNVIFPIFMLMLFPLAWIITLPANFIIDSLIIFIGLKVIKSNQIKSTYLKVILKVWILGFLADLIGSGILLIPLMLNFNPGYWWGTFIEAISMNPFGNIFAFMYVAICIIIVGIIIYYLNFYVSFSNTDLSEKEKHKMAFLLAICTAPYLFLLPTYLIYGY